MQWIVYSIYLGGHALDSEAVHFFRKGRWIVFFFNYKNVFKEWILYTAVVMYLKCSVLAMNDGMNEAQVMVMGCEHEWGIEHEWDPNEVIVDGWALWMNGVLVWMGHWVEWYFVLHVKITLFNSLSTLIYLIACE